MSVYRFKIFFEDDENVYREIEIKATQTFEDFHKAIQKAINFDDAHPASVFISNDTWRKGKELKLMRDRQNDTKKSGEWMHEIKIAKYIEDPHQKMVYEFDPDGGNWTLLIELVKILPDSPVTYPRVNKSVGTPPVQYKITTPVEVAEEDDETEEVVEDDNYVKSMPEHYEEDDNSEVEHEIKAHNKIAGADEEGVVEEATEGDGEGEATEGEGGLEEEDI